MKLWFRGLCPFHQSITMCERNYSLVINKLKNVFFQQKTHSLIVSFKSKLHNKLNYLKPRKKIESTQLILKILPSKNIGLINNFIKSIKYVNYIV